MIRHISIENFKIHKNLQLSLSNLNLLTGMNSSGKSSVIQALLLLRQSYENKSFKDGLILNANLVDIGKTNDAFCKYSTQDINLNFSLTVDNIDSKLSWSFSAKDGENKNFIPLTPNKNFTNIDILNNVSLFNNNFQYINADHITAKNEHETSEKDVEMNQQISSQKGKAEWHIHFLQYYKNKSVLPEMQHQNTAIQNSERLLVQVQAWLNEISPNTKIIINNSTEKLELSYKMNDYEFKPINIGFGVSYILPILIAVLSANKDSLIIIENPESHIHPKGQSKLGELLGLAARAGVQIIVETHSDHILNGVLKSVKNNIRSKGEKGLSKEHLTVTFFNRTEQQAVETHILKLSKDGFIQSPPKHFFDQYSSDINYLLYNPQKPTLNV